MAAFNSLKAEVGFINLNVGEWWKGIGKLLQRNYGLEIEYKYKFLFSGWGLHTHIKISQSIIQTCFKIGAGFALADN